jgi:hypothetical protein
MLFSHRNDGTGARRCTANNNFVRRLDGTMELEREWAVLKAPEAAIEPSVRIPIKHHD